MKFMIAKGIPCQVCDKLDKLENVHLQPWVDSVTASHHIFDSCCFQQEIYDKWHDLTFQHSLIFVKHNTYDGKDWYLRVNISNILFADCE